MKNTILIILTFLTFKFSLPSFASPTHNWKIDKDLKFHLVYLGAKSNSKTPNSGLIPTLNHIPSFQPDITNIQYSAIVDLGFPLPSLNNADQLKLYLKLYQWPKNFRASVSSRKILDPFLLSQIPGGQDLDQYISDDKNVLLKFASIEESTRKFTSNHPLNVLLPTTQSEFDSSIPFSSIYVQPAQSERASTEAERADKSAEGVRSVYQSLLSLYKKIFISFGQDEKNLYFAEPKRCSQNPENICGVRVYTLPTHPLVFKNYKDLPMPQDTENIFLSGLLLVKLTDYATLTPVKESSFSTMTSTHKNFSKVFQPTWAHMLEIGSVFSRKN